MVLASSNQSIAQRLSGMDEIASLKDDHFGSPDHEWTKWIVVSYAPDQIARPRWTDKERQHWIEQFDPDHIDEWGGQLMNRGDFCRMRGIAANTPMENLWDSDFNAISTSSWVVNDSSM